MGKTWYYAVDGVRNGPVTFEELRALAAAGALRPLDLVWQPEFGAEWHNAGQVSELFPPPAPAESGFQPLRPADEEAQEVPIVGVTGTRPSCLQAVSEAFGQMVSTLFRPFDIARWFSMGFCAWLAYIGTGSTYNFNRTGTSSSTGLKQQFDHALDKCLHPAMGAAETALIVGVLVFGVLLAVLFCRLRSRGDFMFLHRWYKPGASISQCWWASRAAGRELFVWRMYFFVIAFLLFALDAALAYAAVLKPYVAAGKVWNSALVGPTVGCATGLVLLALVTHLVAHLTKAFVVPIMYWQGVTASRAWLAVFALCNQYPVAVLGYLLCGVACATAAGLAILAFGVLTCCIGFIPMVLPYFGAVALLPYYLFFRGYAVCFLSQWRAELVPRSM